MAGIDLLLKYFPGMTERQKEQFAALLPLYEDWNSKINVISRKDMDNFYEHHVLHSLAIAKVQPFKTMAEILDVGTGGGFPGIPLAIIFLIVIYKTLRKFSSYQQYAQELGLFVGLTLDLFWGGSIDNCMSLAILLLSIYQINRHAQV